MSYVYTAGLKVVVEDVLTALTETPTVYAYDFLTGDALTSPAPTITSVRTGVYRLSVTANVLTDVLFVFIPHQDDEDKIGQEALMHEKMYHVVDELANGVTLADGAITATKIASNAITDAKIANNAITGDKVATTAVTKIQSGLATSSALTTVGGNVSAIPTNPLLTNDVRLGNLDAKVSDVKTQTDKIPASPAAVGSKMKLDNDAIDANVIKADAVTKIQSGLATPTNITGGTITNLTNLPSAPADWLTASAVKADAVTKIQSGLATSANVSTVGSKVDGLNDITAQEVWEYSDRELSTPANYKADVSGIPAAVWGYATRTLSSFGSLISDIWSHATRTLSAFGFTVATNRDADITAIKGKTDNLPANTATAIGAIPTNPLLDDDVRLDHLDADISSVGGGGGGATAQEVWSYGSRELSTPANYKADISGLATASALSTVGGKVDAVKAKTDNLPPSPAAVGSAMILTSAYDKAKDDVLTPLGVIDGKADAIKLQTDKIPNTPAVTGEYTSALTAIQADLDNPGQYKADISGLAKTTDLSGLAEKTDIPSDYAKANDLNGLAKTTDITALNNLSAAEMLNEVVVGTFTLREILTILAAKSDGYPATGGGTTTITYGGIDGTPGVIVETVDEDGNRSKVEFNL